MRSRCATIRSRRRIGRIAERPVVARRVLRRIRHDGHVRKARLVERRAQRAHAPVHHVGRGHHVGSGARMAHRLGRQEPERLVVVHAPALVEHAAMAVARVLAQAHVGDHVEVGRVFLDGAHGLLHHAAVVVSFAAPLVLARRKAEQHERVHAAASKLVHLGRQLVDRKLEHARHGRHLVAHAGPGFTNTGYTRSPGSTRVSRTNARTAGFARMRRGR